jgi:hypothetical protein
LQSFFQPDWDLERLHRIESALRIQHAGLGNRSILLGDETEIMRTGNAQPCLQLADPELHDVIVGLHPFGEEAFGFGAAVINSASARKPMPLAKAAIPGRPNSTSPRADGCRGLPSVRSGYSKARYAGTNLSVIE